jgi:aryl sulfotransferase
VRILPEDGASGVEWDFLTWIVLAVAAAGGFLVLQVVWLAAVLVWEDRATIGPAYYGRSSDGRRRFRERLRRHARLLRPVLTLLGRVTTFTFARTSFRYGEITGPKGTCDRESFQRGARYEPTPEDVFVVAQMRCGTTWMLHLAYQILHRGGADLARSGTTLHAAAPWLESRKTAPAEEAPLLGQERPSRLIKTHFPVGICPQAEDARYVYVTRHPVSCFASCVDFIAANAGSMAPELEVVEEWFCSEEMWWGPWPDHVEGWWRRAREAENVLFVHFEEMQRDLAGVARRVAGFLDVEPLEEKELDRVLHRCSFDYMERHAEAFEMHPPHILSVEAELFRSGRADRHADVPDEVRRRVARWCAGRMAGGDYPLVERYPDVAGGAPAR